MKTLLFAEHPNDNGERKNKVIKKEQEGEEIMVEGEQERWEDMLTLLSGLCCLHGNGSEPHAKRKESEGHAAEIVGLCLTFHN